MLLLNNFQKGLKNLFDKTLTCYGFCLKLFRNFSPVMSFVRINFDREFDLGTILIDFRSLIWNSWCVDCWSLIWVSIVRLTAKLSRRNFYLQQEIDKSTICQQLTPTGWRRLTWICKTDFNSYDIAAARYINLRYKLIQTL